MRISAPIFALFLGLFVIYEDSISVSAFAPAATLPPTVMKNNNKAASQLNYLREAESSDFVVQNFDNDDENDIDPMEEAFDNMKHPMELMLLNRACIPFVAEGRPISPPVSKKNHVQTFQTTTKPVVVHQLNSDYDDDSEEDFVLDPMEEAIDNMQHPMELMLLSRACIPYVAETKSTKKKAITEQSAQSTVPVVAHDQQQDNNDFVLDPMEEAIDNMQHPMELMLLNRACIPYVAN